MKNYQIALLALIVIVTAPIASVVAGPLSIAAVVNSDVITSNDVEGRYNMAIQGANIKPSAAEQKVLRRQALDSLIDEQIRLQEAARMGITPSKEEIDEAFNKVASQNRATPEQFKQMVQSHPGVYESLRQQIKAQIAWGNVIKKKIRPQINITESDITAYLEEKEKNPSKVEYQVAEIFLKNTDNNQKLATQLISEMRSGKQRFSAVAQQFSEGLEASKGGLLGWIGGNRLEPVLDQALKSIKPGQITDPIISPRGIHILLLLEKRDVLPLEESTQKIGLKQIVMPLPAEVPEQIVQQAMAQAKFFQDNAKDCASMDEVIKKINQPSARDMGMVKLSDLPSSVVSAVKSLPIGKISDPIRSKDSLGLFMVCEREENAEENIREDVGNIIGTERLNRLQYRYYRDLRAAAYVDIK
jgi:peptidyl-prolyl cis-trans isomerase SurA